MSDKPKVDNFAALVIAVKQVLPFAVLFYVIDFVIYNDSPQGLMQSMYFSTLFILGFLVIDFFIARSRLKSAGRQMQPQVIVVQQPVYMPQPGYGYPPYAGQPQQGAPPQPYPQQGQLPPQGQAYYPPQYYQQAQAPPQQQPVTAAWPPPQAPPPPPPPVSSGDDDAWLPQPPAGQDPRKRPPGSSQR